MICVIVFLAYIQNGNYNIWVVDWGNLSPPPCYRAAVNNIKAVARCTGELLTSLRVAGLQADKVTCVGHSLGKTNLYWLNLLFSEIFEVLLTWYSKG